MKHQVFGRLAGTDDPMTVLMTDTCASNPGRDVVPATLDTLALTNIRHAVQILRRYDMEGYVVFAGDPRHYPFTPEADFIYPAAWH